MNKDQSTKWVWVDTETTGLGIYGENKNQDVILELAAIITDHHLNEVSVFEPVVVKASESELGLMDEYVRNMHTSNGLLNEVAHATCTRSDLDAQFDTWLENNGINKGDGVLCGSSVAFDDLVLLKDLPTSHKRFNYRKIDVSSFRLVLDAHWPNVTNPLVPRASEHRALSDIRNSIEFARHYFSQLGLIGQKEQEIRTHY